MRPMPRFICSLFVLTVVPALASLSCTKSKLLSEQRDVAASDGSGSASNSPKAGEDCATGQREAVVGALDGSHLIGHFYPAGAPNRPGIVLQHMIPPKNDRNNFPPGFIQELVNLRYNVLNLDRRGAGESDGNPEDAYKGPLGAQDVQAAALYLTRYSECHSDPSRVAFIGASNGTTSIWDYAVKVSKPDPDEKYITPRALIYLSGGSYTENQSKLAQGGAARDVPILFLYPESEKAWNESQQQGAPGSWVFQRFSATAHGTHLLAAEPASVTKTVQFLREQFK